jgi:hypothetical protein
VAPGAAAKVEHAAYARQQPGGQHLVNLRAALLGRAVAIQLEVLGREGSFKPRRFRHHTPPDTRLLNLYHAAMPKLQRIGLPLALCAALVLALPGCGGGAEEHWISDTIVEQQALEPIKFDENVAAGRLQITITQKVRARETPVERLSLVHTETYSDFDWDGFGLVFFSILGGIASIGLYFVFAFVVFPGDDEED